MFEFFAEVNTIQKFMRKVILWTIFLFIIPLLVQQIMNLICAQNTSALSFNIQNKFTLFIITLIKVLFVFLILKFIKKSNYYLTKLSLFLFLIVPSILYVIMGPAQTLYSYLHEIAQTGIGLFYSSSAILHIFKSTRSISGEILTPLLFSHQGLALSLSLILSFLICYTICIYGYLTTKNLNKLGYIIYRLFLFITLLKLIATIIVIFSHDVNILTNLFKSSYYFFDIIFRLSLLLLITFDIQKIKNLGLEAIKKDDSNLKCSILLCALVLYFDFTASWMRVLIPWGWKKE